MADVFTPEKRSSVMALIRSRRNRSTEIKMIHILREADLHGWRRHVDKPGRPDFVFLKYKVAIFIDGCFWHICPKCGHYPKSNRAYWVKKLNNNVRRDRAVSRELRAQGWTVIRVWECALKSPKRIVSRITRVLNDSE